RRDAHGTGRRRRAAGRPHPEVLRRAQQRPLRAKARWRARAGEARLPPRREPSPPAALPLAARERGRRLAQDPRRPRRAPGTRAAVRRPRASLPPERTRPRPGCGASDTPGRGIAPVGFWICWHVRCSAGVPGILGVVDARAPAGRNRELAAAMAARL